MNKLVYIIFLLCCLQGCKPQVTTEQTTRAEEPVAEDSSDQKPINSYRDTVVAKVNESTITQYQLDQIAMRTLGIEDADMVDQNVRENLLKSLALMRAVSQLAEETIEEYELAEIEQQVQSYREELLSKAYFRQQLTPMPVTQKMVQDYYQAHPDKFGGRTVRHYQLLVSIDKLEGKARELMVQVLGDAEEYSDWQTYAQELLKQGQRVQFRQGHSDEQLLEKTLRSMVLQTEVGQVSKPFFIQGNLYVLKIVDEKQYPPKPLSEVSMEIRKLLAPKQLQQAIKQASEQILASAKIEYFNQQNE